MADSSSRGESSRKGALIMTLLVAVALAPDMGGVGMTGQGTGGAAGCGGNGDDSRTICSSDAQCSDGYACHRSTNECVVCNTCAFETFRAVACADGGATPCVACTQCGDGQIELAACTESADRQCMNPSVQMTMEGAAELTVEVLTCAGQVAVGKHTAVVAENAPHHSEWSLSPGCYRLLLNNSNVDATTGHPTSMVLRGEISFAGLSEQMRLPWQIDGMFSSVGLQLVYQKAGQNSQAQDVNFSLEPKGDGRITSFDLRDCEDTRSYFSDGAIEPAANVLETWVLPPGCYVVETRFGEARDRLLDIYEGKLQWRTRADLEWQEASISIVGLFSDGASEPADNVIRWPFLIVGD